MTSKKREHCVVATYDSHARVEAAVNELQQSGLEMRRVSIVGKDFHANEDALGFYTSEDRAKSWGLRGAFWGTSGGVLLGGAIFFLPAIGPLIVVGPLAGQIASALTDTAIGRPERVLAAALSSSGIPQESVASYEHAVKSGSFLVVGSGAPAVIQQAHAALGTTGPSRLTAHAP